MYLLVFTYKRKPVAYAGPFLTQVRANEYAHIHMRAFSKTINDYSIKSLIVPNHEEPMARAMATSIEG